MPPTALLSTTPPNTSTPGTTFMTRAARLAVSATWFFRTTPRMPRAFASWATSMSSRLRPNTSGCECTCMSMTPAAGLTLGGGGGNAACASASPHASRATAANGTASKFPLRLASLMVFLLLRLLLGVAAPVPPRRRLDFGIRHASVALARLGRLQGLALGDAGDVEALEIPVLLVELQPHPHEQVVEGVLAVAERQPLDRLYPPAPLAIKAGQVVLEEHDGGGENHAPALGQHLLGHPGAVEIGDLARTPQVELDDTEVLAQVVVDVLERQDLGVELGAVGAAALLEYDREALALGPGLVEVLAQVEEGELEPALAVQPLLLMPRRHARSLRADGWRQVLGGRHPRMHRHGQRNQGQRNQHQRYETA